MLKCVVYVGVDKFYRFEDIFVGFEDFEVVFRGFFVFRSLFISYLFCGYGNIDDVYMIFFVCSLFFIVSY